MGSMRRDCRYWGIGVRLLAIKLSIGISATKRFIPQLFMCSTIVVWRYKIMFRCYKKVMRALYVATHMSYNNIAHSSSASWCVNACPIFYFKAHLISTLRIRHCPCFRHDISHCFWYCPYHQCSGIETYGPLTAISLIILIFLFVLHILIPLYWAKSRLYAITQSIL